MTKGAKALHGAQMSVLQPYIARGDIKVLADAYTKDWLPSEAYLFTLKAIESPRQKSLRCSLLITDSRGAIQALREHVSPAKCRLSRARCGCSLCY